MSLTHTCGALKCVKHSRRSAGKSHKSAEINESWNLPKVFYADPQGNEHSPKKLPRQGRRSDSGRMAAHPTSQHLGGCVFKLHHTWKEKIKFKSYIPNNNKNSPPTKESHTVIAKITTNYCLSSFVFWGAPEKTEF